MPGTWVIDLDGVIWLTGEPIEGVDTAVEALRAAGIRTLFATNNSAPTRAELHARMKNCGITAADEDLLTSADVAAEMLPVGTTALVLADGGVREALLARGVTIVESGPVDAVVVGWTRGFTFDAIAEAATRVREGARPDRHQRGPDPSDAARAAPRGRGPAGGGVHCGRDHARGRREAAPPHRRRHQGPGDDLTMMVGDRPSTDGALAGQLGIPFALVLPASPAPMRSRPTRRPTRSPADLSALVQRVLAGS